MYINNNKRKLDSRDLDTLQNAEYFTCIYYRPRGKSIRSEFKTYKDAYRYGFKTGYCGQNTRTMDHKTYKKKFMFYAVAGTSQTFIGGLK